MAVQPVVFRSVMATALNGARVSLAFFDGVSGSAQPACVAILECSIETALTLMAALGSVLQPIEK